MRMTPPLGACVLGGGLSFQLTYRFMKNSWSCLKSVFYYPLHLEAAESCLQEQIYYCSLNQHCILNPWKSLPLQPARWDEEQAGVCWGANVAFKSTFTCFSACWSCYTDPNPHLTSSRQTQVRNLVFKFWRMPEMPTFIRNKRFPSISYKVCVLSSIQDQISLVSKEETEWICFQTWFRRDLYKQSALNSKLCVMWRPDAAKDLPISACWFKLHLRMCDIIIRTSKAANRTSSDIFPRLTLSDEL